MAERLTKDEIIRALLDTSFSRSVGATSLTNIADSLHIKKASLYNHFNSREDLIFHATESCAEYMKNLSFIPADIDSVAKKYPAETVLKGIVNRYFKMHEKAPLFQIYTYIHEQKYFSAAAATIVNDEKIKIIDQTKKTLIALAANSKININITKIDAAAVWFCSTVNDLLSHYLMELKQIVMKNPVSGEGELFTLQTDESALKQIDALVEQFIQLIG